MAASEDHRPEPPFPGELRGPGQIDSDSTAEALQGAWPGTPDGFVAFKGFLSTNLGGFHRLYIDDTFWRWVEVAADDIRAQIAVPPNAVDPRSVIWVNREAKVTTCKVDKAECLVDEVWGGHPGGVGVDDAALHRRPPW